MKMCATNYFERTEVMTFDSKFLYPVNLIIIIVSTFDI